MKTSQGISSISALQIGETESILNNQCYLTPTKFLERNLEKMQEIQAKTLDLSSGRHTENCNMAEQGNTWTVI